MHASLSDAMRTFIDEQVESGAHHNHSEYVREPIRNDQRRRARERIDPREIYLSVITVGEIRKGIERVRRRGDRVAAQSLDDWLVTLVDAYGSRVLPIDQATADRWGLFNVPDPIPVLDGLVAATALVHGLTVATRNLADFEPTAVDCFNPFA